MTASDIPWIRPIESISLSMGSTSKQQRQQSDELIEKIQTFTDTMLVKIL